MISDLNAMVNGLIVKNDQNNEYKRKTFVVSVND